MSDSLAKLLGEYRDFLSIVATTFLILILAMRYWDRVSLWLLNIWYSIPLCGKLARLARVHRAPHASEDWHQSERTLCNDYKRFVRVKDRRQFLECKTYLKKAGDSGRRPLPFGIWLLIAGLVFVEALGFSYVLAGWSVPGASENRQVQFSYGLAFVFSVILVAFTHFAGHELYRSNTVRHALKERSHDRSSTGSIRSSSWDLEESLNDPSKPQSADDDRPAYTQLANRVGAQPTYMVTVLTLIAIFAVASITTVVRNKTFEHEQNEESAGQVDPNYGAVPSELSKTQSAADDKAATEGRLLAREASLTTFILLAILFVFLQILGILFGMKWGFAGRESAKAYALSGGKRFATFEDYRAYHLDYVVDVAQSKLESLRQRMTAKSESNGWPMPQFTRKGFLDFVAESQRELPAPSHVIVAHAPALPIGPPATSGPAATHGGSTASLPPAPAQAIPLPPVPPPPALLKYHFTDHENRPSALPVSRSELDNLFAAGAITQRTWVLLEGAGEWIPYGVLRVASRPPPSSTVTQN
ncbi:MAG TPA: hypothetical protein VGM84_22050 [Steroidobacteraceae bacterium]|jgi:hypothetical protein